MNIYFCTDDGVYKYSGGILEKICCASESVYDLYIRNNVFYICSNSNGVFRYTGESFEKILDGSCWRFYMLDNDIIVSQAGPKLYRISDDSVELLAEYTEYAREYDWWFPHGSAHITDITEYNGQYIASVEVGNLLAGESLDKLKPLDFNGDQHNLLTVDDRLIIAAASGVYYTRDLKNFKFAKGSNGYFHALDKIGDKLVGHTMDSKPLKYSEDYGETWNTIDIELPKPTFGVTGLKALDEKHIIYATTSAYKINLNNLDVKQIIKHIPMTRRIVLT